MFDQDKATRVTVTYSTVQVDYDNGQRWIMLQRFGDKELYCGCTVSEASLDLDHIKNNARELAEQALRPDGLQTKELDRDNVDIYGCCVTSCKERIADCAGCIPAPFYSCYVA